MLFTRILGFCAGSGLLAGSSIAAFAQITINEILADNQDVLSADGSISDWVELYNASGQPFSLAGYSLTDSAANPRKWIFPANVTVPANGYLVVLLDSSRPPSATSAFPLNTGFAIKASGDRVDLYAPNLALVESVRFGAQAPNFSIGRVGGSQTQVLCTPTPGSANVVQALGPQAALRINEWMASPSTGEDWFELYNPGTLPVQLSGLYFTDSGNEPSPVAPLSFIGGGLNGYLQIIADNSTNDNEVNFKLGGGGDSISLFDAGNVRIDTVSFGQQTADISQGRLPDGTDSIRNLNTPTPGKSNLIRHEGLVVNELLSHTDPPLEDAVEFYNSTSAPIDISGWYLSNSRSDLKRYRIPNNTVIPAKGYYVIYEAQFNGPNATPAFTFNSAHGDEVYLAQAINGELTGTIVFESFEAAENGVSFGRHETSVPGDYKFVAMQSRSFGVDNPSTVEQFRTGKGLANPAPKVGPVVINEVMYHPPAAPDGSDNILDEYIELQNITGQAVPLHDVLNPGNRWRLQDGVSFTFPAGTSLPANGFALVVNFDPVADAAQLSAFRTKYSVPAGVQIFGPYSGKLDNAGDSIELYKPDPPQLPPHPDAGFVPYIRVDKVNFLDAAPWPTDADGTGKSLQRKNSATFGNDPANWQAAAPSSGKSNSADVADTDGDGLPDVWESQNGFNPNDPSDAAQDTDSDGLNNFQEYLAGTDPRNAQSRLQVGEVRMVAGVPQITFSATPGKSYSVQVRNSFQPSFSWEKLASTNATSSQVSISDTEAGPRTERYYRVTTPAVD